MSLVARALRGVMGVRLQDARCCGERMPVDAFIAAFPEAETYRAALLSLAVQAPPLAAVVGNLERLRVEYPRAVRRADALNDVLLPWLDHDVRDIELRLEDLEQEDSMALRPRAQSGGRLAVLLKTRNMSADQEGADGNVPPHATDLARAHRRRRGLDL